MNHFVDIRNLATIYRPFPLKVDCVQDMAENLIRADE